MVCSALRGRCCSRALLTGTERPEIAELCDRILKITPYLTMPRYPRLGFPEMATTAAHDHDMVRKLKVYEDFVALRPRTREFIRDLKPVLEELEFPANVRAYFETLMARTGFSPLPAI